MITSETIHQNNITATIEIFLSTYTITNPSLTTGPNPPACHLPRPSIRWVLEDGRQFPPDFSANL